MSDVRSMQRPARLVCFAGSSSTGLDDGAMLRSVIAVENATQRARAAPPIRTWDLAGSVEIDIWLDGTELPDGISGITFIYDEPASAGVFTAKDPTRFAGGDANLYAYAASDPINFFDPSGHVAVPIIVVAVVVGAGVLVVLADGGVLAIADFGINYQRLREANIVGADAYFHCLSHCMASSRGIVGGEVISDLVGWWREYIDYLTGDSLEATCDDFNANEIGQEAGRAADFFTASDRCPAACEQLRPPSLNPVISP